MIWLSVDMRIGLYLMEELPRLASFPAKVAEAIPRRNCLTFLAKTHLEVLYILGTILICFHDIVHTKKITISKIKLFYTKIAAVFFFHYERLTTTAYPMSWTNKRIPPIAPNTNPVIMAAMSQRLAFRAACWAPS